MPFFVSTRRCFFNIFGMLGFLDLLCNPMENLRFGAEAETLFSIKALAFRRHHYRSVSIPRVFVFFWYIRYELFVCRHFVWNAEKICWHHPIPQENCSPSFNLQNSEGEVVKRLSKKLSKEILVEDKDVFLSWHLAISTSRSVCFIPQLDVLALHTDLVNHMYPCVCFLPMFLTRRTDNELFPALMS